MRLSSNRAAMRRAGVVMAYRTAVRATGRRTTVIFGTMSHLTTGVVRYRTTMRATRRPSMRAALGPAVSAIESMRRHDTMT